MGNKEAVRIQELFKIPEILPVISDNEACAISSQHPLLRANGKFRIWVSITVPWILQV